MNNTITYLDDHIHTSYIYAEIKMKRLESPPSGHFMIVARVPVAPLTIRRHIVSETKPML